MKMFYLICIVLFGVFVVVLFVSQVSQVVDLVFLFGYYVVVGECKGSVGSCFVVLLLYIGSLVFISKYEGFDLVWVIFNVKVEKIFCLQIKDIIDMECGVIKLVIQYMCSGCDGDLVCVLNWMSVWVCVGVLQSDDFNYIGKFMCKWVLGSFFGVYMCLKFFSLWLFVVYVEQSWEIEDWFVWFGIQVVCDWSGLLLKKINNYFYWVVWLVMFIVVVINCCDFFDWVVSEFKVVVNQVDEQGFLFNEFKCCQCVFVYYNYVLLLLVMIVVFVQVNGVDLCQENYGVLQCLVEWVMKGVDDEEIFEEKIGEDQDMIDFKVDNKYVWLEFYCVFYCCELKMFEVKKDCELFNSFCFGGEVMWVFSCEGGS